MISDVSRLKSPAIKENNSRPQVDNHRKAVNEYCTKLVAEAHYYIKTFAEALGRVQKHYPDIFESVERVLNLDKTEVITDYGKRAKVFGSSSTNHRGFKVSATGENGKHVTAVVAISAGGKRDPPFFIVEGKNMMPNWFKPL